VSMRRTGVPSRWCSSTRPAGSAPSIERRCNSASASPSRERCGNQQQHRRQAPARRRRALHPAGSRQVIRKAGERCGRPCRRFGRRDEQHVAERGGDAEAGCHRGPTSARAGATMPAAAGRSRAPRGGQRVGAARWPAASGLSADHLEMTAVERGERRHRGRQRRREQRGRWHGRVRRAGRRPDGSDEQARPRARPTDAAAPARSRGHERPMRGASTAVADDRDTDHRRQFCPAYTRGHRGREGAGPHEGDVFAR
jgi:hypothetical protein